MKRASAAIKALARVIPHIEAYSRGALVPLVDEPGKVFDGLVLTSSIQYSDPHDMQQIRNAFVQWIVESGSVSDDLRFWLEGSLDGEHWYHAGADTDITRDSSLSQCSLAFASASARFIRAAGYATVGSTDAATALLDWNS